MAFVPLPKHPDEKLIVAMDFTADLAAGDSVSAGTANSTTLTIDQVNRVDGLVSARISGGVDGSRNIVTYSVTTTAGEVLVAELPVIVGREPQS